MEILKANELTFDAATQMSSIFVDGFYEWLKYFSKNKEKLRKAFQHIFNNDAFFVAVENDVILSMAACPTKNTSSVILNKKEFTKHLGFVIGRIAYTILHHEFEVKKYPIDISSNMGQIEFVATKVEARGKGITHILLEHIISNSNYDSFILEVASNNTKALNLYYRLGFKEVKKIPQKNPKKAGFEYLLYLQLDK